MRPGRQTGKSADRRGEAPSAGAAPPGAQVQKQTLKEKRKAAQEAKAAKAKKSSTTEAGRIGDRPMPGAGPTRPTAMTVRRSEEPL